ncbi:recombinase family protein [Actinomyces sp. 186855]|nr:recombinase family protein [Actinomyces sp. AC-20-1]MCL3789238.1 recombinase family protein [Actinomyces sp. 187325]MCL3791591.1 recombinase family protein [Actinomyces sp. 186855]MCL3793533.1 recombinase family protein [Actinomyces sp. 217892]
MRASRTGYDAVLDYVTAGDVLVAWRLDRLCRTIDVV